MKKADDRLEFRIVEIENEYEKALQSFKDINIELTNIKKEVEFLKLEVNSIKTDLQLLKNDTKNAITGIEKEIAPLQKVFNVVGGLLITAVVGAILSLVIKSQ